MKTLHSLAIRGRGPRPGTTLPLGERETKRGGEEEEMRVLQGQEEGHRSECLCLRDRNTLIFGHLNFFLLTLTTGLLNKTVFMPSLPINKTEKHRC